MFGARVRTARKAAGWTQAELAARAGVSRQLVAAVEAGRHLPRIDAGAALADALGVSVEALLAPLPPAADPVVGDPPAAGTPVRLGRVGDRLVCAPAPTDAGDAWGVADAVVEAGGLARLPGREPGAVVAGCDPAIGLAGTLATERGRRVVAVNASTALALEALADGRAHAAVVHGPADALPAPPEGMAVRRLGLARWQVGLAAPGRARAGWAVEALAGRRRVIQRDPGAGSQRALERAVAAAGGALPPGPVARGHLDAARRAAARGLVAVTIEPAARAVGLAFHPLETHIAQLWVVAAHASEPGVAAFVEALAAPALQRRLAAIGGYDLAGCGDAA